MAGCWLFTVQTKENLAPGLSEKSFVYRLLAKWLRTRIYRASLTIAPQHHRSRLNWCRGKFTFEIESRFEMPNEESSYYIQTNDDRYYVRCTHDGQQHSECIRHDTDTYHLASWWHLL